MANGIDPGVWSADDRAEALYSRRGNGAARPGNEAGTSPAWVDRARAWVPLDINALVADVKFAVQWLIPLGKVGVLVSAGGTGKTTLLLILSACIAIGRPFFGYSVTQGTTLLLSSDDPQEDLEAALALICTAMDLSDAERTLVYSKVRLLSLIGDEGTKTFTTTINGTVVSTGLDQFILQAVEGIDDLVCVALDTLRQFSGGSSNDEQVIKLTIADATTVALRTGAAVILPHHTGKQNYRDGITDMYCGSGSAAIADNCRFVLLLQTTTWADIEAKVQRSGQEQGDPLVLTSTRGSLRVKPIAPVFMCRDGYSIGLVKGKVLTRDQQLDKKDRDILAAVRRGAKTKRDILAEVTGKTTETSARIDDLERRGLLTDVSQSVSRSKREYMLSTDGAKFLDWPT